MNASQVEREQREQMFVRAMIVRRLMMARMLPSGHHLMPTEFMWDILRESERGGN